MESSEQTQDGDATQDQEDEKTADSPSVVGKVRRKPPRLWRRKKLRRRRQMVVLAGRPTGKPGEDVKVFLASRRAGRMEHMSAFVIVNENNQIISYRDEDKTVYKLGDTVYVDNPKSPLYYIAAIESFGVSSSNAPVVKLRWYYRVSEIPDTVASRELQDRRQEKRDAKKNHHIDSHHDHCEYTLPAA